MGPGAGGPGRVGRCGRPHGAGGDGWRVDEAQTRQFGSIAACRGWVLFLHPTPTRNGAVFANSQDVADYFGKNHFHVLGRIDALLSPGQHPISDAAPFTAAPYRDANGEQRPAFDRTRDGFALLAMGFTGAKARASPSRVPCRRHGRPAARRHRPAPKGGTRGRRV